MLITRLELDDFKSYAHDTVRFESGTNAIVGQNGSGKSSLLEAIGFALFDSHEDAIANYVRDGATAATIVVSFISSLDEREYEVERRIGKGAGRYRVYDVDLGRQMLAEGSNDVVSWLHTHLRVDPSADLPTLFRNTVGVPQGSVTSAFLGTAAERKAIFDPLLQVSDYDRAWSALNDTRRHLEQKHTELRIEIASLESRIERLPGLIAEQDELDAALATLAGELERLEQELTQAQEELAVLDSQKEQLQRLVQRDDALRNKCASDQGLLEAARRSLLESEQAAERLETARPGHEAYQAAETRLTQLEQQRAARDKLHTRRTALETQAATLATRLQQLEADLRKSREAERRLAELAPLVERQDAFEAALVEAQDATRSLAEAERRLSEAQTELERAQSHRDQIDSELAKADALQASLAECDHDLETLSESRRLLIERQSAAQADLQRLDEQTEALSAIETARCPVCEAELTQTHRDELLGRNTERRNELEALMTDLAAQSRTLTQGEADARTRRTRIDAALRALPGQAERDRAQADVTRRMQAVADAQAAVAQFADARPRLAQAQSDLQALGDPRHAATQQRVIAAGRVDLESARDTAATELARLAEAQTELEHQLAAHADLNDLLSNARALRERHQVDHETWLSSRDAAEQRELREQQATAAAERLEASRAAWQQAHTQAESAAAAYQPEHHARAAQRVNTAHTALGAKTAEQQARGARRADVSEEICILEKTRRELTGHHETLNELAGLIALVARVRELLKQAGPEITRQRVRRISLTASQLYADIMADHRNRLVWSEDYALALDVQGQVRSFRQLSGGEQMAAALALRLALLRETSSIDIAFFDEPTAHLDPERRGHLAEQIMNVKGFAQLFVISHDDSFEQWARNQLHVVKGEHGSSVETE